MNDERAWTAWLKDGAGGVWLRFAAPREVLTAHEGEVRPRLEDAGRRVEREGLWAVGAVSYEAGPAFDPALAAHAPGPDRPPLLWLALCDPPKQVVKLPPASPSGPIPEPVPSLPRRAFLADFADIQEALAAGDAYQVNYSFRLRSPFGGDPWSLFHHLLGDSPPPHAAYLPLGVGDARFTIVSASPELFFEQDGDRVASRPMKGTAPRGRTSAEDREAARALVASPKERAENLMVVDMVRNDLGRVARPGSVRVEELFTVERYPTVLQMTSTVAAETDAGPAEVFAALFPCASITGAPKVAATRIIRRLEAEPRGIYTGAVGYLAPGRRARFSVAIRTAVVDRRRRLLEYGVGSGVVADSDGDREHAECLVKARVFSARPPAFELLETLAWEPEGGFWLLDRHLARLEGSAAYFGFTVDLERVAGSLRAAALDLPPRPHKVRLTVSRRGEPTVGIEPLDAAPARKPEAAPATPLTLALAGRPVDSFQPLLFHKTTERRLYRAAQAEHPAAGEVLLVNERGEVTEGTRFNLVVEQDGRFWTPPAESGLLPGVFRAHLLAAGRLAERVLVPADLERADRLWLVNSVRGFRRGVLTAEASTVQRTRTS